MQQMKEDEQMRITNYLPNMIYEHLSFPLHNDLSLFQPVWQRYQLYVKEIHVIFPRVNNYIDRQLNQALGSNP
jgi:hypothetical protein